MHTASYHRHRFPAEVIQHAVWLYFRFPLSFRDVEDLLAQRTPSTSNVICIPSDTSPVSRRSAEDMASGERCSLMGMFTAKSCECQPVM
jgi:hypothetical protein